MKFRFYLSESTEQLHPKEFVIGMDDLSDVIKETEKFARYKGKIDPTFMGFFLDSLYRIYRFQPIYGVNYSFCIDREVPKDQLHHVLWQVIKKSNMFNLVMERKCINILENIKEIQKKHGDDFIVRAILDSKDATMLRKWGIEFQLKDVASELGFNKKVKPQLEPQPEPQPKPQPEPEVLEVKKTEKHSKKNR